MKKIIMCLLSLGLISGCVQQKQTEEPPVVVDPSEDDEQESKLSYTIQEITYSFENQDTYLNNFYTGVQTIRFDDDSLNEINHILSEEFNRLIQENDQQKEYDEWRVFTSREIQSYDLDQIVTFIIKDSIHANHTGGSPRTNYYCYHIDKEKKELLTNEQFLERNNLNIEEIQNKINHVIETENWLQEDSDIEALWHIYGTKLNNDSCIFIENGKLNMYITVGVIGLGDQNECYVIN